MIVIRAEEIPAECHTRVAVTDPPLCWKLGPTPLHCLEFPAICCCCGKAWIRSVRGRSCNVLETWGWLIRTMSGKKLFNRHMCMWAPQKNGEKQGERTKDSGRLGRKSRFSHKIRVRVWRKQGWRTYEEFRKSSPKLMRPSSWPQPRKSHRCRENSSPATWSNRFQVDTSRVFSLNLNQKFFSNTQALRAHPRYLQWQSQRQWHLFLKTWKPAPSFLPCFLQVKTSPVAFFEFFSEI